MNCDIKDKCAFCANYKVRFQHPLDEVFITQRFGDRPEVYSQFGMKGHNGIDYRTKFPDTPLGRRYVYAAADGVIEEVRYDLKGYGVHIRQRLDDGGLLIYGHLTKPYAALKATVRAGDKIGLTGNTGFSSAPHLHFEYRPAPIDSANGFFGAVDPLPYLPPLS